MPSSRSDRSRSASDSANEKVFWDEISALKKQIKSITPGAKLAPQIIGQPSNAGATTGGTASLAVAVIGEPPFTFQWRKDGVDIAGAIGPVLVISGTGTADAGNYSVVVTNQAGTVESTSAVLTVTAVGSDVPVGGIIMWAGTLALIPTNYHLCDGSAGTPDLRDKFVCGSAAGIDPGVTGGNVNHKHAAGTLVNDSVSAGTPAGTNDAPAFTGTPTAAAGTTGTPDLVAVDVTAAGITLVTTATGTVVAPVFTGAALAGHLHTITGDTADQDGRPPFYSLAFIQRVS